MHKRRLMENIEKIHTTEMGAGRICRNLEIDAEPVEYCISKLNDASSTVRKEGKNYYVDAGDCTITVNAGSFTIITAHKNK